MGHYINHIDIVMGEELPEIERIDLKARPSASSWRRRSRSTSRTSPYRM